MKGDTKRTFNEKRVAAMSPLEKEKQESKENKATVACSTEKLGGHHATFGL